MNDEVRFASILQQKFNFKFNSLLFSFYKNIYLILQIKKCCDQ